ncbi:calcium-binding and coiled-coil domain-containing protein 1 [Megalops cyprinoides]|uniref:calcium-binding and coiled-coil domain-containing protein 1 n=1 Tax=Megalops cyprinoides TaxID=118141 RepID=UPI0018655B4B|nr:calcium-binding and coiled-coil domain-containing protein 1 [Megalops cyprinoides]
MEKAGNVEFRNVGRSYFPQSRVECHYSLSAQHSWASNDWIGLFKMGWTSVRNYHTFVWALVPAGYQEGTNANCCVHFQASYLPKPGAEAYQFVYVDGKGAVCARSSPFTFCAPKPLEDLVTLEEGEHGAEEGEDLLLVVPRAELLQSRLEECLQERAELLHAREAAERESERERKTREWAKREWDRARKELEEDIRELKEKLRRNRERMEEMEKKQQEVQSSQEAVAEEKEGLLAERAESQKRIKELEDDIKALTHRGLEKETELERMKERIKKMTAQRRDDENERKRLQCKLEQTEEELRGLSAEFQSLRSCLAQRDTHILQLKDSITTLTHRLNAAQRKEAENEATVTELRSVQERLAASERTVEGLKGELSVLAAQRDRGQTELHQARMQAAQLTLQLADASLALREGRASWAQEREALQHTAEMERERVEKLSGEVQQKEEWLQEERMEREKVEVELGREKDCNRELKACLRVAQKEKEQLLLVKEELMQYMRQLEQRLEAVADARWSEAAFSSSRPDSPLSDSEDENPEALQPPRAARPPGAYSLCDPPHPETLLLATPPPSPRELSRGGVVISQPAPLSSPRQPGSSTLTHSSESEEEQESPLSGGQSSGEETALLLPERKDIVLSELIDSPPW